MQSKSGTHVWKHETIQNLQPISAKSLKIYVFINIWNILIGLWSNLYILFLKGLTSRNSLYILYLTLYFMTTWEWTRSILSELLFCSYLFTQSLPLQNSSVLSLFQSLGCPIYVVATQQILRSKHTMNKWDADSGKDNRLYFILIHTFTDCHICRVLSEWEFFLHCPSKLFAVLMFMVLVTLFQK